jgi:DNA repair exonuclease SbcCD ATPase subunit
MAKNTTTRAAIRAALQEVPEDFYTVDELLTEKVINPLTPLRFVAQEDDEPAVRPYDEFPEVLELPVHDVPAAEIIPAPLVSEEELQEVGQAEAVAESTVETQRRRGWFGRSRRTSAAADAPASAPASVPQPPAVHDDVYAGNLERDEARRRFAALEADLVDVQSAREQAEIDAKQMRDDLDAVRSEVFTQEQARAAADAAAQFAQEQLDELRSTHDALSAEHDEVIGAYAQLDEQRRAERDAITRWESHARELTETLEHEREEFLRTLEDERHTSEQARAAQAFQHREQLETHAAHTATTIAAIEKQLAETQTTLEATNAELGATRAEVVRATEDLQAARGEAEAANARSREEGALRVRAEQRLDEVQEELAYVRSEVMGGRNDKNKKGGLLRRGAKPSPLKSLEPQSRPIAQAPSRNAAPAAPVSEELDEILERRLFGGDA